MTTTYAPSRGAILLSFLALLTVESALAQSLEERVNEARKLQAQSMSESDALLADSVLRESRTQRLQPGMRAPILARTGTSTPASREELAEDSLLGGPRSLEEWDEADSLSLDLTEQGRARDSVTGTARRRRKKLPRRYEQRIFQSVDRSAFSSTRGAAGRDHVLGPGDAVVVSLWGDREREYDLTLDSEGRIFLEGVGLVPLAGRNLNEAKTLLKERMARIYSGMNRGTAHVDISLAQAGPLKAFVLGEVKVPGGYVFTGNASVLSAMYFAQGPSDIGTVRNLQLTRGGKSHPLDLYQYLLRGKTLSPEVLRDGDILFAGRAEALIEVAGDVGRPAVYELRKGEGVKEILEFAGGLNPTAAVHKLTLQRIAEDGTATYFDLAGPREYLAGHAAFELRDGDRVFVEKSTEPARNFITIEGPVKYPGTYSADSIRTIQDVVRKAGGLREDAFIGRVHVLRHRPDGSSQLFSHFLDTLASQVIDIQARDSVILYSVKEMLIPDSVEISGAVFNPGKYEFREGMTVKDLVMQAGGFLRQHESGKFLVFRDQNGEHKVDAVALSLEAGLEKTNEGFILRPRDFVQVPTDPRWYNKEVVTLDGLFLRPGKYVLLHPGEKLSSVIHRAGGFKEDAYVEGARFHRTRDSVGRVGVDIRKAIGKPGSKADISLVGGDSILIPARVTTVKVIGEVGFETSVMYEPGRPVQYYVERAGGFTRRSERNRIVVQYANGETSQDGYFIRKPDAGSVIHVPRGPEPQPVNWVASINALLGTLGVATALILSIQAISK